VGGQVDMLFSVLPIVLPYIGAGKLRVVAVASDTRSPLIPDAPTMKEAGFGQVTGSAWNGVMAPAGSPQEIIQRLNNEISTFLAAPETKDRFTKLGMQAVGGSPADFAAFLRGEAEKWAKVIKTAGIKVE
jgi:tripartite-type tricarboxylate transporter receptor subunit TctC